METGKCRFLCSENVMGVENVQGKLYGRLMEVQALVQGKWYGS
jgi:hypothetical protein